MEFYGYDLYIENDVVTVYEHTHTLTHTLGEE